MKSAFTLRREEQKTNIGWDTDLRSAMPGHDPHRHPEKSRRAILNAAVDEFAEHGIAGARIDAIAKAAQVNKALLYYYFNDKDALYEAVLDHVFSGLQARIMPVFQSELPPREKLLEYVGRYFDYIAENPRFPRVVQAEWMRMGQKGDRRMLRIARQYFRPIYRHVAAILREGADKGELRRVNPVDFLPTLVGMIVFYFSSAPRIRMLLKIDPLSKARIAERRQFVLAFVSTALFNHQRWKTSNVHRHRTRR